MRRLVTLPTVSTVLAAALAAMAVLMLPSILTSGSLTFRAAQWAATRGEALPLDLAELSLYPQEYQNAAFRYMSAPQKLRLTQQYLEEAALVVDGLDQEQRSYLRTIAASLTTADFDVEGMAEQGCAPSLKMKKLLEQKNRILGSHVWLVSFGAFSRVVPRDAATVSWSRRLAAGYVSLSEAVMAGGTAHASVKPCECDVPSGGRYDACVPFCSWFGDCEWVCAPTDPQWKLCAPTGGGCMFTDLCTCEGVCIDGEGEPPPI